MTFFWINRDDLVEFRANISAEFDFMVLYLDKKWLFDHRCQWISFEPLFLFIKNCLYISSINQKVCVFSILLFYTRPNSPSFSFCYYNVKFWVAFVENLNFKIVTKIGIYSFTPCLSKTQESKLTREGYFLVWNKIEFRTLHIS